MFEIYCFKKDYRNLANMFFEVGLVQIQKGRKKTKSSGTIRVLLYGSNQSGSVSGYVESVHCWVWPRRWGRGCVPGPVITIVFL